MRFTPKSEEELQMEALFPEGIYPYQVIKAEDTLSHAGNEYIKMTIKIWDESGREQLVFTNLALVKLLKHFCDMNNLSDEYASGNVPAERCYGKTGGLVQIGIEGEKPNPNGGMYKAKNIVKDYIADVYHRPSAMKPLPDPENELNDEIPF